MMTNNLYTVNHHFVTYSLLKGRFLGKAIAWQLFFLEISQIAQ